MFDQNTKFESGTGLPSFYMPPSGDMVGKKADNGWFMQRTEVHCNSCGARLGHVFTDGPAPNGLRNYIKGVALKSETSA